MDTTKKIIIVEDNDLYRAALRELINSQENLEVVAEAADGEEAIRVAAAFPADLVLLDLRLPGTSGYDALPRLSKKTAAKILVLSILESHHNIRASLEAGADGYCFKDVSSQELLKAIATVLSGERYVSRPALDYPEERRAEPRQGCDHGIIWVYFNRESAAAARMLNCSRIGCYFETSQPVTAGATISIRLEHQPAGSRDHTPGLVRSYAVADVKWCEPRSRHYGVGARYHF